jgi:hypothetical protein
VLPMGVAPEAIVENFRVQGQKYCLLFPLLLLVSILSGAR